MVMQIHIDLLSDRQCRFEFEEKPENFAVLADMIKNNEYGFLAPIKTALRAYRVGDLVEVEGNLETLDKVGFTNEEKEKVLSRNAIELFSLV